MKTFSNSLILATVAGIASIGAISTANADGLSFYGDFRFRAESDWDSARSNGIERDDRDRLRIRLRGGLKYNFGDGLELGARVRTGAKESHQSPHITIHDFDDNDTGDKDISLDKWYLSYKKKGFKGWVGRNGNPFWRQNEFLWDDDVTPAGVALSQKVNDSVSINAGYFATPDGMEDFGGELAAAQLVYSADGNTLTAGIFNVDIDDDAEHLVSRDLDMTYNIWNLSAQHKNTLFNQPLTLGVDLFYNSENDKAMGALDDEDSGYVLHARLGKAKEPGQLEFRYYYANIERFAVVGSYAQDDWFRWGSATVTRASDFKGHELRLTYKILKKLNVVGRLYVVDTIENGDEDGNRFRLDFNYKF